MSHFSCLVIGPDPEAQLAPFHEFECTGTDNEYVKDVDKTDELRADYETHTVSMCRHVKTGELISRYDDQFYRDPTAEEKKHVGIGSGCGGGLVWSSRDWGDGRGYRAKVHDVPAGWVEVQVPIKETQTLAEFAEYQYGHKVLRPGEARGEHHKYGFAEVDANGELVRCIDRTNPDRQWDWWVVGGRWCGFFPLKEGADGVAREGAGAAHGLKAEPRTADQLRKGDVDFDRARDEAAAKGTERFTRWENCLGGAERPSAWSEFHTRAEDETDEYTWDQAREAYRSQPAIDRWNRLPDSGLGCPVAAFGFDQASYVQRCRDGAIVPFAIVKDGKWHEKGSMGWFGCVSDERPEADWGAEARRLYDDLPDDTLLTLVDCHI